VGHVRAARDAIDPDTGLFVDANGAYDRTEALARAAAFAEYGVKWFEEPVSSDDLEGLRLIHENASPGMPIAAGEYGYDSYYFRLTPEAGSVLLQADCTRCAGITGLLAAGNLCSALPSQPRYPRTPRQHCMRMLRARFRRRSTWNAFSTTTGLSRCSLRAH